jgi:hypothetical protein
MNPLLGQYNEPDVQTHMRSKALQRPSKSWRNKSDTKMSGSIHI